MYTIIYLSYKDIPYLGHRFQDIILKLSEKTVFKILQYNII